MLTFANLQKKMSSECRIESLYKSNPTSSLSHPFRCSRFTNSPIVLTLCSDGSYPQLFAVLHCNQIYYCPLHHGHLYCLSFLRQELYT